MSAGTFNQPTAGYQQQPPPAQTQPQARGTSGKATASLVLGILAVLFFVVWASFVFGPLAIVFGVMGRNETRGNAVKGGYGMATAGMVCGIIGIALTVVFAAIGFATT